tara:strand:- start:109 stop:882 length:774 start_codon:yes stop_codon:yes gene_type:complete
MKLTVIRTQFGTDATNGILLIDDVFECYTLEDQYQEVKVMHETCIPEGAYNIKLRTVGGFHTKYKSRYNTHKGMLHLQDVPGFTYILIHAGNTDEHTSGCLIVGETQQDLDISKDGFIGHSGKAYIKLYDKLVEKLLQDEEVIIEYTTIANLLNSKPITNRSTKTKTVSKQEKVNKTILLKKGSKGTQVEQVQIMLNLINKTSVSVDADFGNKTLAAVVSFQKKHKIKPDGIVGNMTYAKLVEVSRSKINKGKVNFE